MRHKEIYPKTLPSLFVIVTQDTLPGGSKNTYNNGYSHNKRWQMAVTILYVYSTLHTSSFSSKGHQALLADGQSYIKNNK